MRVVVCALAKNEHRYINEWVSHYVKLGFDKLYIYDNDDSFDCQVINYIDKQYVDKFEIRNIRMLHEDKLQQKIYTNFYRTENSKFDWCLFCDIDEFLTGVDNIKDFLSQPQFKHAYQIRIKWKLFDDNNLIERDMSKSVMETFTHECKFSLHRNLKQKGNLEQHGKMIVRGNIDNVIITSPHFASVERRDNVLVSILPSGKPCRSKVAIEEDYRNETVFLNHYMTKSLSEFIEQKMNRTDAVYGGYHIPLDYYWRINKMTKEKIDYLRKRKIIY